MGFYSRSRVQCNLLKVTELSAPWEGEMFSLDTGKKVNIEQVNSRDVSWCEPCVLPTLITIHFVQSMKTKYTWPSPNFIPNLDSPKLTMANLDSHTYFPAAWLIHSLSLLNNHLNAMKLASKVTFYNDSDQLRKQMKVDLGQKRLSKE